MIRFQSETSVFKFLQRIVLQAALKTDEAAMYINCERPTANQQTHNVLIFLHAFASFVSIRCVLFVYLLPILNKTCVYSTYIFKFTVVLNETEALSFFW